MTRTLEISLFSGKSVTLERFKHLFYIDDDGRTCIESDLEQFYLNNKKLVFVCENSSLNVDSNDIEFIKCLYEDEQVKQD